MEMIVSRYQDMVLNITVDDSRNNKFLAVNVTDFSNNEAKAGSIYIGRIKNIVKNINAAFVEIADRELCFLQFKDEAQMKMYHNESEILVQVIREKLKTKQAAVTTDINLNGKYLVKNGKDGVSVSSKIKNVIKRNELISILNEAADDVSGYIIRTNAVNASKDELIAEYNRLEKQYNDIIKKSEYSPCYTCIYSVPEDYILAVRDSYDENITRIRTDDVDIYRKLHDYLSVYDKKKLEKLSLYDDASYPLSALYQIETKLLKAVGRRVWLDSGAYLVIDVCEACTVIDVNTGKAVKKSGNKDKHFFDINVEAAKECFEQIRLRNISGVIIIDFVDMISKEYNDKLMKYLNEFAAIDNIKTSVVDKTALGFVEVTRKKVKKPLYSYIE